jgi:hypothetical protein
MLIPLPCPLCGRRESLLTFRDFAVAAMFCVPCEHAWTEVVAEHPVLKRVSIAPRTY